MNKLRCLCAVGAAALGAIGLATGVRAQEAGDGDRGTPFLEQLAINIDFEIKGGPGQGIPAATFGGAANQPGVWNRIFDFQNPASLNDIQGNLSPVVLTRFNMPASHGGIDDTNTTGDHEALLDDFWAIDQDGEMVFENLPSGFYEVFTYGIFPANPILTSLITIDGADPIPSQQAGGPMPPNNFRLGNTHTKHRVRVGEDGLLNIKLRALVDGAAIGGLQIRPAEPCPVVEITSPGNFACICESEQIEGNVTIDAPGSVAFWYLESREIGAPGAWDLINFGFNSGLALNLGLFDTTFLSGGYYFLRLTAWSADGCIETDEIIVYVDKFYEVQTITTPVAGNVYGGSVCIGGIINDNCFQYSTFQWAPLPAGTPFTDVDGSQAFYFGQSINPVVFATWDTVGQMIPDGEYRIRSYSQDTCGFFAEDERDIIVDNTPPTVEITSPENCSSVSCTAVEIRGTVMDPNLQGWTLSVLGGPFNTWTVIASGNTNVGPDGVLTVWDTDGLPLCCYTLRLRATDTALINCNGAIAQASQDFVSVEIGLPGDGNGDGELNFADITYILNNWLQSCF